MKHLLHLLIALFITTLLYAQAPQKMTYQAVIRDATSTLIQNKNVGIRISILQGTPTGTAVYSETHTASTNANGLVTIEVGGGSFPSTAFSSIDWSKGPYFIKTEVDPTGGSSYTISGSSQLLSVPYALYAATSGSGNASTTPVIDNLTSTSTTSALSANQGKVLKDLIDSSKTNSGSNSSSLTGDVSSTGTTTKIDKIQGNILMATTPQAGQALRYNGLYWTPTTESLTGDVTGPYTATKVTQLQTIPLAVTAPASGQIMKFNGVAWIPEYPYAGNVQLMPQIPGLYASTVQEALYQMKQQITIAAGGGLTSVYRDNTLTGSGISGSPLGLADGAVTFAKMDSLSNGTLIGRFSTGKGKPEAITIGNGLSLTGGTLTAAGTSSTPISGYSVLGNATGSSSLPKEVPITSLAPLLGVGNASLTMPSSVFTPSPATTTSGSLSVNFVSQPKNTIFAGPITTSGLPSFRVLDATDIPSSLPNVTSVGGMSIATSPALTLSSGSNKLTASGTAFVTGSNTGDQTASSIPYTNNAGTSTTVQAALSGLESQTTANTTAIAGKMTANTPITASGTTPQLVTYDTKGLVTGGIVPTTANIAASTDKNYVTDAQLTALKNTSGTNSGDQTIQLTGDVTGISTGAPATTINTTITKIDGSKVTYTNIAGSTTNVQNALSGLESQVGTNTAAIASKVTANTPSIAPSGSTPQIVTYDAKGLVTSGKAPTATDIAFNPNTTGFTPDVTTVQRAIDKLNVTLNSGGLSSVTTDGTTLDGSGTASDPLKIKDGGISPSSLKSITGNGSSGQVLTSDGTGGFIWGTGGTTYTLPAATTSKLGGIKTGTGLSITTDGTLSANQTASTVAITPITGVSGPSVQDALQQLYSQITTAAAGGLTAVNHDGTLTGDGTASSKLGIATGAITSDKIASGAVTSDKIADGAVIDSKIASGISGTKITTGTIPASVIPTVLPDVTSVGGVTISKLPLSLTDGTNTLTTTGTTTVSGSNTGDQTITFFPVVTGDVTSPTISSKTLLNPTLTIANGAVTDSKIASGIDATKITKNTLLASVIPTNLPGVTNVGGLTISKLPISLSDGTNTLTATGTATVSGSNTGDVTLTGENYLSLSGQAITAKPIDLSGSNAAGVLAAGHFPALTGDVTTTAGSLTTTLSPSGVTAGTYTSVTVDNKGRVTIGANPTSLPSVTSIGGMTITTNPTFKLSDGTNNLTISGANTSVSGANTGDQTLSFDKTNHTLTISGANGNTVSGIGTITDVQAGATSGLSSTVDANGIAAISLATNAVGASNLKGSGNTALIADNSTTGEVLTSNGNGTFSWTSASSMSVNPSNITLTDDYVFIGTSGKAVGHPTADISISALGYAKGDVKMGNGTTNYNILNLKDPTNPQDAATKNYVDTHVPASLVGAVVYKGTYDASADKTSTGTSLGTAGPGNLGYYYVVSTAGSYPTTITSGLNVGDWVISDGTSWSKVANGTVSYTTDMVPEAASNPKNLYFTDARVAINPTVKGKQDISNINKDKDFATNVDDTHYPSVLAVKSYIDGKIPSASGIANDWVLTVESQGPVWKAPITGGTVTSVNVKGLSGSGINVTNNAALTTTPEFTLSLGAITPTSIAATGDISSTGKITATNIGTGSSIGTGTAIGKNVTIADGTSVSGSNTGDQIITLSGDLGGTSSGAPATTLNATIQSNAVTSAKILDGTITNADIASQTIIPTNLKGITTVGSSQQVLTSNGAGGFTWGSSSATNLNYSYDATNGYINSSTGTKATIPIGSTTEPGLMLATDKVKLDGAITSVTAADGLSETTTAGAVSLGINTAGITLDKLATIGKSTLLGNSSTTASASPAEIPAASIPGMIGLGNVENTKLSTWTGSTYIKTLGTITTGIWNGTIIDIAHGGTGNSTGNAVTATTATTATNVTVVNTGSGTVYPTWVTPATGSSLALNTSSSFNFTTATGTLTATKFSGDGSLLTNLNLTNLNATNLTSGTIPGTRYGAGTIPITSLVFPTGGDGSKFLANDGSWKTGGGATNLTYARYDATSGTLTSSTGTGTTITEATTSYAGLLNATDKTKLSNIPTMSGAPSTAGQVLTYMGGTGQWIQPGLTYNGTTGAGTVSINNGSSSATIPLAVAPTTTPTVTSGNSGLMTPTDKSKLDSYPASTTTSGLVLMTNSNGNATWQAPSGGSGGSGPKYYVALNAADGTDFPDVIVKGSGSKVSIKEDATTSPATITITIPADAVVDYIRIRVVGSSSLLTKIQSTTSFSLVINNQGGVWNQSAQTMLLPNFGFYKTGTGANSEPSPGDSFDYATDISGRFYNILSCSGGILTMLIIDSAMDSSNSPKGFYMTITY